MPHPASLQTHLRISTNRPRRKPPPPCVESSRAHSTRATWGPRNLIKELENTRRETQALEDKKQGQKALADMEEQIWKAEDDANAAMAKRLEGAQRWIEKIKTPADHLADAWNDIMDNLEAGFLTPEQADKAIAAAHADFDPKAEKKKAGSLDEPGGPVGLESRTAMFGGGIMAQARRC